MNRRSMVWCVAFGAVVAAGVVGVHHAARADVNEAVAESFRPAGFMAPQRLMAAALETVDLRPDQRASIDALESDVETGTASLRAAHERALSAVAASVEAGALDHATIDPLVADVQDSAIAARPVLEDAANRLHAILDEGQREQLVRAIRNQMIRLHHGAPDHLAALGARIGVTDEQLATIRAHVAAGGNDDPPGGFAAMREHIARAKELADAFVSDSFDARALQIGDHATMMSARATKMLAHLDGALPVLTAAQRHELAKVILAGPTGS